MFWQQEAKDHTPWGTSFRPSMSTLNSKGYAPQELIKQAEGYLKGASMQPNYGISVLKVPPVVAASFGPQYIFPSQCGDPSRHVGDLINRHILHR